jgi:phosphatidylethanolamine/phosphatidyl-N-methylethanolamine N-methyltransferase
MLNLERLRPQPDDRLAFLQGFLRRPRMVGSVVPSSRFMERRLIAAGGVRDAEVVVELGPGTGGTTRALLGALSTDARLLAIELNPRFAAMLAAHGDPRLLVEEGSAERIGELLTLRGLPGADVVISGVPFSTMPAERGRRILREIWSALRPGGRFVAYQFRDRVAVLGRELFGRPSIDRVPLNVPPMRVYSWRKPAC